MSEQIITVSITLVVDSLGTTEGFHFSTRGFASKPTDTPANTVFDPRVVDAGEYRRELFSGARVAGLSRPSFGSITLSNHDGALDDWMGYGVSGAPVVVRLGPIGGNFPGDFATVFRAYAKTPTVDFASVVIPLEDRSVLFDRPIVTEVFDGRDAFVIGSPTKKKPLVLGRPGYVPLVLVDPVLSIYYVQSNAVDASFLAGARVVYDGGMPLTYGGLYATPLEGVTVAPATGHFRAWANTGTTGNAGTTVNSFGPCYVRLGSPPEFDVRIDALGLYLENPADPIRWWTFPDLVRRAGATDVTAATLAPNSYPANVGNFYIDADQTYAEVLSDSAQPTFSAFGFDRLDRFFTFDLKDPNEDATEPVVFTFTVNNARNFRRQAVPGQEKPVRQVNVSAGRTWPGSVANGATPENKELFAREPWQTQFTVTSDGVLTAHPGAISVDVVVQGAVQATDADKLAFGQKYITLYGGLRELITLECTQFDATTIGIELGAKVAIRMPRFLCDSGRNFRVVTQTINLRTRTVSFGLWGGTPGPSDAALGGGTGTPTTARDYFLARIPAPETFALIAVQDVAMLALGPTPAPTVYSAIEGGSAISGPSIDASLALLFEGPDGSTTIIDSSPYAHTVSQAGSSNVEISDTDPAVGVGAGFWDTNRVLSVADDASLDLTTGDFAITARVRATSLASTIVVTKGLSSDLYPWQLAIIFDGTNAKFAFRGFNSGGTLLYDLRSTTILNSFLASPGTWFKVTGTRSGNTFALLVNDATEASVTASGSLWSSAAAVAIGGYLNTGSARMSGKLDEVIIVKGAAALPVDPLAALDTLLDLRFDGTDAATTTTDSSVYAWPVTLTGGAELDTAQKYSGTASLLCNGSGARAVIGSTGIYLQSPGGLLEFYIRPATVTDCVLMTKGNAAGFTYRISLVGGKLKLENNGMGGGPSAVASGAPSVTAGAWSKLGIRYRRPASLSSAFGSIELLVDDVIGAVLPWIFGSGNTPNSADITIGADYDGSSAFNGHIDNVTVTTAIA